MTPEREAEIRALAKLRGDAVGDMLRDLLVALDEANLEIVALRGEPEGAVGPEWRCNLRDQRWFRTYENGAYWAEVRFNSDHAHIVSVHNKRTSPPCTGLRDGMRKADADAARRGWLP